jgi:hypothetical protein
MPRLPTGRVVDHAVLSADRHRGSNGTQGPIDLSNLAVVAGGSASRYDELKSGDGC